MCESNFQQEGEEAHFQELRLFLRLDAFMYIYANTWKC